MPSPIRVERPGAWPRTFVPAGADPADWAVLEPLFSDLESRPLPDADALRRWLADRDELLSCWNEERARRQIEMTCATEDPVAEARHLHVVREIDPRLKPAVQRLKRRYLDCPHRSSLDGALMEVHDRALETEAAIFRDENVALEKEDALLRQRFQKISAAMTVPWRGEERTLQQMALLQQSTDRAEREEAWRLVSGRRMEDRESLDALYGGMVALRHAVARNAGFADHVEYIFPVKHRFDYTPADCEAFHEAVEACAVPFLRRLDGRRRERLGLDALRPWDRAVDETGRPPLRPFEDPADLAARCRTILDGVDPAVGEVLGMMMERGLLDLDSRPGKAPGGYQSTLDEVRLPFIFMNAAGTDRDVFTLLHEAGHAFHAVASRGQPLLAYRHCTAEIAEVASMGMEMLCADRLAPFYGEADAARSLRHKLESTVAFFPWCASIDAFQHRVYRNPGWGAGERTAAWNGIVDRFGGDVDWSGLETERGSTWQAQLHVFQFPFYYIEYAVAQMGALQLWVNWRRDPEEAVARYKGALALGGSRPLPELFAAAGLRFDLSRRTLEPLVAEVEEVLAGLPD